MKKKELDSELCSNILEFFYGFLKSIMKMIS